jgi:hypothetical protein
MADSLAPTFLDRLGRWYELRPVVYFIEAAGTVKIGTTTRLWARSRQLQASSPVRLAIVAVGVGDAVDEARLHERYAEHRSHGEWFTVGDWLPAAIASFPLRAVLVSSLGESTIDVGADWSERPLVPLSVGRGPKCCAFRSLRRGSSGLAVCASCGAAA